MSQAGTINSNGGIIGAILTLTGNSGGAVGPDGAGNINVPGNNSAGINIVGNPGTNTLTVTAYQATTSQRGTVLLATNAQAIAGVDSNNAVTSAALAAKLGTQTAHSLALFEGSSSAVASLGVATNGQLPIGSTGADPVLSTLTAGTGISITNGAGSITLSVAGSLPITFDGDTGSATPSSNTLTIKAGTSTQNCGSSVSIVGSGSTLTLNVTDANTNTLIGASSGNSSLSGNFNAAVGSSALNKLTSGQSNTAVGVGSLFHATSGSYNVSVGCNAADDITQGSHNVAVGYNTFPALTTGGQNVGIGQGAGGFQTGSYNICLGYSAGSTYATSESSNICVSNSGTISESNVIRIGTQGSGNGQQDTCYVAGIAGVTGTSSAVVVGLNTSTGQLLQTTIEAGTGVTVTPAAGSITIAASGAVGETITGNTGGALSPTAGNWNILGTGSITTSGSSSTLTVELTGLTNHAVLVGAGTATVTNVGPTATAGQVLQSAGSSSDPVFSTATYPSTTTINQLLYSSSANVVAGLATADNGVLTTGTGGVPVITQIASDGQLIIGSSAGAPAAGTLTAGTGISITNGHNSITIATTGTTFLNYTNVNTSPYTVLSTDEYLSVDCSGGAIELKFPNAPTAKQNWIVKDRTGNASTNNITITTPGGTVTFDGLTTYTMASNYQAIQLIANATPTYEVY